MKDSASSIAPPLLERVSQFIVAHLGLHFAPGRWVDLERGILSAARDFGFTDVSECVERLLRATPTRQQIQVLAGHLTIGETYLFRDRRSFELFEHRVLPEVITAARDGDRSLRFWSAGCCTGEEAYSIAISIDRVLPCREGVSVRVLGTDINANFLRKAAAGAFGAWSFRDVPAGVKDAYFQKVGPDRYQLVPAIKRMVSFGYLNLADDVFPAIPDTFGLVDVIFCRNVLLYLDGASGAKLLQGLGRCLREGGWLFLGATESPHEPIPGFVQVTQFGATCFRKHPVPMDAAALGVIGPLVTHDQLPPWRPAVQPPEFASGTAAITPTSDPQSAAGGSPPVFPNSNIIAPSDSLARSDRVDDAAASIVVPDDGIEGDSPIASLASRSRTCANNGQLDLALAWCDKAIAAEKLDSRLHFLRASILQERGDLTGAAAALRQALYLEPELIQAHFALGHLAHRQGKSRESARYFANTLQLLRRYQPGDLLPDFEGMTAGHLAHLTKAHTEEENAR